MQPLKLAFLCPRLSWASGGLSASVPNMAHELGKHTCVDVTAFGILDPSAPLEAKHWAPRVEAFKPAFPSQFFGARGMLSRLSELSPDVIDVQGLWTYPSLLSLRYARRVGSPYVVTPRGMLDPWALNRSALKKRVVRMFFEDKHLAKASCIRTTASLEAEHARDFGLTQPIAIIPNGVNIPEVPIRAHEVDATKTLLFMSRIHPKKGLPILLDAWARIHEEFPDWTLVIAGPDEVAHSNQMKDKAKQLSLKRLKWVGPVFGLKKDQTFRQADLFVLPTHGENFGLVVAEALSHGVPVITTRAAPWDGLLRENCGWWINLSADALTEALIGAMSMPSAQRQGMGIRGRAWMEREFGWEGIAQNMLMLYEWLRFGGTVPNFVHR